MKNNAEKKYDSNVLVLDRYKIEANKDNIQKNEKKIEANKDNIHQTKVKTGKTATSIIWIKWILGICLPLILTSVIGIPLYLHGDIKASLHNNMNALKTNIENLEKNLVEKINRNMSDIDKINKYGKIKPDYEKTPWRRTPEKNENIDRGPASIRRLASQPSFTTDSVPASISGLASPAGLITDKEPANVGESEVRISSHTPYEE